MSYKGTSIGISHIHKILLNVTVYCPDMARRHVTYAVTHITRL